MNNENPAGPLTFTQEDLKDFDWDDSEQIEHWDRVKAEYERMKNAQSGTDNEPPYGTRKRKRGEPPSKPQSSSFTGTPTNVYPPSQGHESMPLPPTFPLNAPGNDDDGLANVIMAWYYCGYYTGLYTAQQHD